MTSHYQWNINAQTKHAPPRLGAPVFASRFARLLRRGWPLRYGPRHYMPPLRGSHLFFRAFPGVPPLRGSTAGLLYTAPPGLRIRLRLRSQNFPTITPSTSDLSSCANSGTTIDFYRANRKTAGTYSKLIPISESDFLQNSLPLLQNFLSEKLHKRPNKLPIL